MNMKGGSTDRKPYGKRFIGESFYRRFTSELLVICNSPVKTRFKQQQPLGKEEES
jgi:hypothetical protein